MSRHRALLVRTAFLLAALSIPVYPCGGPDHYDIDAPLASADQFLQAVQVVDDWEYRPRPALRFLYPFVMARVPQASALWLHAYGTWGGDLPTTVDTTAAFDLSAQVAAFEAAGESGEGRAMERAARTLVDAAFDVPAIVADEYQPSVRKAIEALEVASTPSLATALSPALQRRLYGASSAAVGDTSGVRALPPWAQELLALRAMPRDSMAAWAAGHPQSPRQGALRFVELQLAMKHGIPDGWANEIRDSVPAERWRGFAAMHDAWERRFPRHPLAPWVAASRIHLAYFAGDTAAAWEGALALYTSHRPRAIEEMRFLLRQGFHPSTLDDPRIDPPLRSALLGEVRLDGTQWRREWGRVATVDAPWAEAARDRLMWRAATDSADALRLPQDALRASAASFSPTGRVLRLIALMRRGRTDEAIAQADSLGNDSTVAPMRVQLLLAGRRWRDALAAPGVSHEARQYLVRVLAPDSVLQSLSGGSGPVASEARRTLAIRAASAGKWAGAAGELGPRDAARAAAWRRMQPIAADTSLGGTLALARAMRARNGTMLWGNDKVWYRSLNWRLQALQDTSAHAFSPLLPWKAQGEIDAIGRHFRDGFEMYHAVRAYAAFLSRAPRTDPRRAAAVREANATYNWLVNWDNNNSHFWSDALEGEGIGRTIRAAGRR